MIPIILMDEAVGEDIFTRLSFRRHYHFRNPVVDTIGRKEEPIGRHSFIRMTKLTDVKGRIDYITNPRRQEHLYSTYTTAANPEFWDYLAGQNQQDFKKSGSGGRCIEARELIIALPEELQQYDPAIIPEIFARRFSTEYGVVCVAALHHNKAMTNYHIHLIFSERVPMEKTEVKRAPRNMFYDEKGRHVRTKKEILDGNGELRRGCFIIPKGQAYDIRYFQPKNPLFKSKAFNNNVKDMMTETINLMIRDEEKHLKVFDPDGPYLAMKKIGKNNPRENQIKADNAARQEWNHAVDEACTAGVGIEAIQNMKLEKVSGAVKESVQRNGVQPDLLQSVLRMAIDNLVEIIRTASGKALRHPEIDEETFRKMTAVRSRLEQQNKIIASKRRKVEYAQSRSQELALPQNFYKVKQRKKALKALSEVLMEYQTAAAVPDQIVREAGYRSVAAFTRSYEKACRCASALPGTEKERQSVLAQIRQYEKEAQVVNRSGNNRVKEVIL